MPSYVQHICVWWAFGERGNSLPRVSAVNTSNGLEDPDDDDLLPGLKLMSRVESLARWFPYLQTLPGNSGQYLAHVSSERSSIIGPNKKASL